MSKAPFTLVILAAGMGSRFGGLKQLQPVTKNGFSILDFSIYDAVKYGACEIIFIIRKETENDFKTRYGKLILNIPVTYVFQNVNQLPLKYHYIKRQKPWGTAHALLTVKDKIKTSTFFVINADDFYGSVAFEAASRLVSEIRTDFYGMVGYPLHFTLSKNGSVSRGECVLKNSNLSKVIERTNIKKKNHNICYYQNDKPIIIDKNCIVSMNFWILDISILNHIPPMFESFLKFYDDSTSAEFYLPFVINTLIQNNDITVGVLEANSKWMGITYKADLPMVEQSISNLILKGEYPSTLWKQPNRN